MPHSKLPWRATPNGAAFNLEGNEEIGGVAFPTKHFCILLGMIYQPEGQHEANANLIITAVNVMPKIKVFLKRLQTGNFQNEVVEMTAEILLKELEGVT